MKNYPYLYAFYFDQFVIHQDCDNYLLTGDEADRVTYTSKHRSWGLVAVFSAGSSRTEAMYFEKFIKKQKSRKLIERLIDTSFIPEGKLAQLVRVPHLRD